VEAEREEFLVAAELLGEKLVDERNVVVKLPDLEDLLASEPQPTVPGAARGHVLALVPLLAELPLVPALFDVAVQLDAQLVGVELTRRRCGHPRGVVRVV